MDNHKWAFYVWEMNRLAQGFYALIHVDFHWDANYDFWGKPDREKNLKEASIKEIEELIREENLIQYDSFIGPAMARGLINDVHFLCFQEDEEEGFTDDVLEALNSKQTIHTNMTSLNHIETNQPILFDFCLDVFNRSDYDDQSDLWAEEEIDILLRECEPLVKKAHVVTVSMSYGYSGTEEDTKRLTEKVVPLFLGCRNGS